MVNFNGNISAETTLLNVENRGIKYGDALFETLRVVADKILFWEDHYFRLMESMRILRMEIPMNFTMEFLEEEILKLLKAKELKNARVRFTVYRGDGGLYLPTSNDVAYIITANELASPFYLLSEDAYEVDLYKDFYINKGLLSTLKTNNKITNVLGSIYAKENDLDNCLLVNEDKNVIEALNGNIFLVKGNTIKTPPITDGCLKGILRKQLVEILEKTSDYELKEESISPFEIQKSDEFFITNVIQGIVPITKYRKKQFGNTVAKDLLAKLNMRIRLG
ncbi:branched-chain amino acid aminotransferase [Kordia periserrulae]|uniref:branched-chain-amino-acid transaminase n=1 Tax=Kordia periserrulae TaxID=701523 RepID=A0A2T6C1G6_9FLAO|nr:aminotransferase class IV [Kordia periserrulae]PTX62161.1 branched-chain amino acid aminotransferase [Kordia periserrulae]